MMPLLPLHAPPSLFRHIAPLWGLPEQSVQSPLQLPVLALHPFGAPVSGLMMIELFGHPLISTHL